MQDVELPEHDTGTLASGDVAIFYRRFGIPGRTPMLIVHGLSYFSYDWIRPAAALAVDREVVAIDMRGFGQSSWSPSKDYKLETISRDVLAVLDHLGWKRAVLFGHSFGGRVCLATAGWTPERAAGVVLADFAPDVAAEGRRHTAERIGGQPDTFARIEDALAYDGHPDAPPGSPRRARMEAFLKPAATGFTLRRDLSFRDSFKRALEAGQSPPVPAYLWPMLGALAVPGLVIRASRSDMFAPETMEKVRQSNPRLDVVELDSSHDLAGDSPSALIQTVRAYLEKLP